MDAEAAGRREANEAIFAVICIPELFRICFIFFLIVLPQTSHPIFIRSKLATYVLFINSFAATPLAKTFSKVLNN